MSTVSPIDLNEVTPGVHHHCHQCDHTWTPRKPAHPSICPKCRSRRWDDGEWSNVGWDGQAELVSAPLSGAVKCRLVLEIYHPLKQVEDGMGDGGWARDGSYRRVPGARGRVPFMVAGVEELGEVMGLVRGIVGSRDNIIKESGDGNA